MPNNNGSSPAPTPQGPVYEAARRVHAAAAEHNPKGMLEVRTFGYEAPFTIAEIAAAFRLQAQACTKQPVEPEWAQAVMSIVAQLDAAATAARALGPAFDALHPKEVQRLLQPRAAEGMWDTTANK